VGSASPLLNEAHCPISGHPPPHYPAARGYAAPPHGAPPPRYLTTRRLGGRWPSPPDTAHPVTPPPGGPGEGGFLHIFAQPSYPVACGEAALPTEPAPPRKQSAWRESAFPQGPPYPATRRTRGRRRPPPDRPRDFSTDPPLAATQRPGARRPSPPDPLIRVTRPPLFETIFIPVSRQFISSPSHYAANRSSGPSRHSTVFAKIVYCTIGDHSDGVALRRSRIWMYFDRAIGQVLRMCVVGMR